MFDGRHVDQKSSRQCDVRSDARAFLGDRFFCDLDQYLLTFAQQVGNRRLVSLAPRLTAMSALIALPTLLALSAWTRTRFGGGAGATTTSSCGSTNCTCSDVIVLAVRLDRRSQALHLRAVAACSCRATSPSSTATRCKFTARLTINHTRF